MSGQVRQAGEAVAEVYRALRDTREGGHSCISVDPTAELIRCPRGVPCNTPKYTLVVFDMFRVFCQRKFKCFVS